MKTFMLWLLQISVPLAFALCLLVLFPRLLESKILIVLSYCLGGFFLVTVVVITYFYILSAKDEASDSENVDTKI